MVTHNTNVRMAMPNTTGTKIPVIRSTMRCTGALLPCASCTIAIIRASTVSLPTCAARMINEPRWLIVPANTLSPFFFSTGTGSPLIILSSTYESPSESWRTTTKSPTWSFSIKISSSTPLRRTRAALGCIPINLRMAVEVFPLARSSINFPVRTKAIITAEAS